MGEILKIKQEGDSNNEHNEVETRTISRRSAVFEYTEIHS
jgi:hypothetical protein